MNKKHVMIMAGILMCVSLILGPTQAHAADLGFTQLHTVLTGSPNETQKTSFGFDETPYLFMELPESAADFTISYWQDPDFAITHDIDIGGSSTKRWFSLDDWEGKKKVGDWHIEAAWHNGNNEHYGTGFTDFTVTPEPLAMTLFLIGGAPIAANLYRKKKRAVTV